MKPLYNRYPGSCAKCGADLPAGNTVVYERRVGIFCLGCAPTDPEEIRAYRQEGANKRAKKYEEWAAKRKARATATLERNEIYNGDYAFNTQPGHIPGRDRVIAANDRAYESLQTARRFESKAADLRHVRVAGDKERARQARRERIRPMLKPGLMVYSALYGEGEVVRVNQKTASVRIPSGSVFPLDLDWLTICEHTTVK